MTLRTQTLAAHGATCHFCGIDCEALEAAYIEALRLASHARTGHAQVEAISAVVRRRERLGFDPSRAWWEAHHLVERADGGGDSAGNVVPVCQPCHAALTADFAGVRAARRRWTEPRKVSPQWPPKGTRKIPKPAHPWNRRTYAKTETR